jgi:hypothetical protein
MKQIFLILLLAFYAQGQRYKAKAFGQMQAQAATINGSDSAGYILIDGNMTVTSNYDGGKVSHLVQAGNVVTISSGVAVTMKILNNGPFQIFSCAVDNVPTLTCEKLYVENFGETEASHPKLNEALRKMVKVKTYTVDTLGGIGRNLWDGTIYDSLGLTTTLLTPTSYTPPFCLAYSKTNIVSSPFCGNSVSNKTFLVKVVKVFGVERESLENASLSSNCNNNPLSLSSLLATILKKLPYPLLPLFQK